MVQQMVASTNHVFVTPTNLLTWGGFTLRGASGTKGIYNIFLTNIGEDQNKVTIGAQGFSLRHMVNPPLVIILRS